MGFARGPEFGERGAVGFLLRENVPQRLVEGKAIGVACGLRGHIAGGELGPEGVGLLAKALEDAAAGGLLSGGGRARAERCGGRPPRALPTSGRCPAGAGMLAALGRPGGRGVGRARVAGGQRHASERGRGEGGALHPRCAREAGRMRGGGAPPPRSPAGAGRWQAMQWVLDMKFVWEPRPPHPQSQTWSVRVCEWPKSTVEAPPPELARKAGRRPRGVAVACGGAAENGEGAKFGVPVVLFCLPPTVRHARGSTGSGVGVAMVAEVLAAARRDERERGCRAALPW